MFNPILRYGIDESFFHRSTHDDTPLGQWVVKTFNLKWLPQDFEFFRINFSYFHAYIQAKGEGYEPHPYFLEKVKERILNYSFNRLELYEFEHHLLNISIEGWVVKTFGLTTLPEKFEFSRLDYEAFRYYLEKKGPYQPDKLFLDRVLSRIKSLNFNPKELQSLETEIFYGYGGAEVCFEFMVNSIKKTNVLLEKSEQMGFAIDINSSTFAANSLAELCSKELINNGYPQAFVDKEKILSLLKRKGSAQ